MAIWFSIHQFMRVYFAKHTVIYVLVSLHVIHFSLYENQICIFQMNKTLKFDYSSYLLMLYIYAEVLSN